MKNCSLAREYFLYKILNKAFRTVPFPSLNEIQGQTAINSLIAFMITARKRHTAKEIFESIRDNK